MAEICPTCGHIETDGVRAELHRRGLMLKSEAVSALGLSPYELKRAIDRRELTEGEYQGRACVTTRSVLAYGVPDDDERIIRHHRQTGVALPGYAAAYARALERGRDESAQVRAEFEAAFPGSSAPHSKPDNSGGGGLW